jgi:uncharacterized membrane protein YgcG
VNVRLLHLVALTVVLLAVLAAPAAAATCTGDPNAVQRLDLAVHGQPTYGSFAFPAGTPRGLVVFGHGYGYNVDAWRSHIVRAARDDGLVAVAMNYRGLTDLPRDQTSYERSRGFPVKAGGEDLVAAALHFQKLCGGFARRFLLGVSLGGNTTGLAMAAAAKTPQGQPLFDYWIAIEGLYNFTETYFEARATGATAAQEDIEKEAGGSFEAQPDAYRERTVLNRAPDIAKAGLKGIVMVHGQFDGLVPYDEAQQFLRAIRGQGVPTDMYTAVKKAPGDQEDDTRVPGAPADRPGHASEWAKHVVIDTGMDRLSALARRGEPPPCDRDFTVDGSASPPVSPDPSKPSGDCPAKPAFYGSAGGGAGGSGGGSGPGGSGGGGSREGGGSGSAGGCQDTVGPRIMNVRPRVRRRSPRTLRIRGLAIDRGCAGAGRAGMRSVRIAVARRSGKRCRFVKKSGELGPRRRCGRRAYLRAKGAEDFKLTLRRLRPGRYRVTALAIDRNGNTTLATRKLRIRRR